MTHLFWLSNESWAAIDPHLPRCKPGKPRGHVDPDLHTALEQWSVLVPPEHPKIGPLRMPDRRFPPP
jgi:hypothetical protein